MPLREIAFCAFLDRLNGGLQWLMAGSHDCAEGAIVIWTQGGNQKTIQELKLRVFRHYSVIISASRSRRPWRLTASAQSFNG
jgi:hypothetical protein